MTDRLGPKPSERVIAHKRDSAGRVTVHGFRAGRYREDDFRAMADCGRSTEYTKSWLWLEYQMLNPTKVVLCSRCWR